MRRRCYARRAVELAAAEMADRVATDVDAGYRGVPGGNGILGVTTMLGAFRSAHAEPRSAAARIGLVALLACIGLTWTAGASSAFATYGTVSITKKNVGGDATDLFHFDAPDAVKAGGFDLKGGDTYTNSHVVYNTGRYGKAYTVSEPPSDKYELKSIDCYVTPAYHKGSAMTSLATRSVDIKVGVGEKVACTFTNERKTGTITVKKQLEPASDTGTFDLQVDGDNVATQVGDGGYGSATVPTGTHTVSESGANLADYVRYTTCLKGATVVAEGSGAVSVPVDAYDQIACTIKNVRKPKLVTAIAIKKSGPATATAGALLTYTLDITNPGDMPFAAADVAVTDAKCQAAPAPESTNGDTTPGVLNPGDDWTYTCKVQSAVGQTSVVNVADVTGTDENGKVVTGEDTFTTTLTQPTPPPNPTPTTTSNPTPPSNATTVTPVAAQAVTAGQQVAGVTATSRAARGTAALRGPRACPRTGTVAATVTGRQIRRVTFSVGGKKVKTVTKADSKGRWTLTVRTSSLRRGANAVVARVEFSAASGTKTRNLRITVTRCAAQAVQPQFTG